jgi:hypothetical protein
MSDKHSRFLNLERGRRDAPGTAPAQQGSGRFDALEHPGEVAPPAAAPSADRFRPPPEPKLALELSESRPEDQPFIRCLRCQMDNHALATACSQCHCDLNTPEQRDFNQKLWDQLRRESEEFKAAEQQHQQRKRLADVPEPDQRAMGEAIAQTVAEETRLRLMRESAGGWTSGGDPALSALARALPGWLLQALAVVFGGLALLLMLIPKTRFVGFPLFVIVVVLGVKVWARR